MKAVIASLIAGLFVPSLTFGQAKEHELQMSLNDRFVVKDTDKWNVAVENLLTLRFANVKVLPKDGHSFSLMLYFKCDTPDLGRLDSPEKMEACILSSAKPYLPGSVEKKAELKRLTVKGWYGYSMVLTDESLAARKRVPSGEFKYITRGLIRLSPDSALGFSLMTNELDSAEYKELMAFVCSFVKAKE